MTPRRIAFLLFPRLTVLDLIGGYDALRRVSSMGIDPRVTCHMIGTESPVLDETGIRLVPDAVYDDLSSYDLLYVPGGPGTRSLATDARLTGYLRGWGTSRPLASVCTGAILIGAAGHLEGLRATTHHTAFDELRPHCREVVTDRRIVDQGRVVTAAGVTSALDLGLFLVERFWGAEARGRIAAQMEYGSESPGNG